MGAIRRPAMVAACLAVVVFGAGIPPGLGEERQLGTSSDLPGVAAALADQLASGLKQLPGGPPVPLVVVPFRKVQAAAALPLDDLLVAALLDRHRLALIDRNALKVAIEETGLTQESPADLALELGKRLGVRVLVTGSIDVLGDGFVVNARAVRVQDGVVLQAASATLARSGSREPIEAGNLTAQLRRLADRIAGDLDRLDGEARYQRFAVLRLEEVGVTTKQKQLGLLVSSELSTLLRRDHGLMLVERSQLDKVLEELALGLTGAVEPEKAVEVGKLAGAQGVVLGTVSEAGDRYLVSARVVATRDGRVLAADQVELPAADLVALSSEAVQLRTTWDAVYRAILLPGWGQLYNRQPVKGAFFAGAELLSLGLAIGLHVHGSQIEDDYHRLPAGTDPKVFEGKANLAQEAYDWRNVLIYVTLGIHLLNVVDAWLNGRSFQSAEAGFDPGAATLLTW